MLKGVPTILCPELLKTLDEMGHNDVLVLGDGNFPGSGIARAGGAKLIRADGIGAAEMLEAILPVSYTHLTCFRARRGKLPWGRSCARWKAG